MAEFFGAILTLAGMTLAVWQGWRCSGGCAPAGSIWSALGMNVLTLGPLIVGAFLLESFGPRWVRQILAWVGFVIGLAALGLLIAVLSGELDVRQCRGPSSVGGCYVSVLLYGVTAGGYAVFAAITLRSEGSRR